MQIADLYIRVSTDEQADKGYSLQYQEETLRRFCEFKKHAVRNVYLEDHSAKSFRRPEWTKLMVNLHKHKSGSHLLLFTTWDRFSRDTTDAYAMIRTLNNLGVEPQAIEQPLDLTIPENKLMLAMYLAQPEVDNHRRSIKIHGGMRTARKQGRFMGYAPPGYRNRNVDGKKWIEVDPIQGPIMDWVFHEITKCVYSVPSIMQLAAEKGLKTRHGNKIGKTCFWYALRNPVYCGKIKIQAYKNEPEELIDGKHEALISEGLFYRVQDVLDGKKKAGRVKIKVDEKFPLRGFLLCPKCGKVITASSSKGRQGHYSYYHCYSGCNVRYPSETVNKSFATELAKWKPHPAFGELYKIFLQDVYAEEDKVRQEWIRSMQKEVEDLQDQLRQNRKFLLAEKITPDDYLREKMECDKEIALLEEELADLTTVIDLQDQLEQAYSLLSNLDHAWITNPIEWKRDLVGSMFPEKLEFTGSGFRTARVNEVASIMFNLGATFSEIKMGHIRQISDMSHQVDPLVHFSNRFLHDLTKLAKLASRAA